MNKTRQWLLFVVGAVLAQGLGACQSSPPEDNTPVTPPPKPPKAGAPGGPTTAAPGQPGAPGAPGAPGGAKGAGPNPTPGQPGPGKPPANPQTTQKAPGKDPFGGAPPPGAAKPEVANTGRPVRNVKFDPFYVTWHVTPPPPYVFLEIEPVQVYTPDVEAAPVKMVTVREEPMLRVSGIMTGDGVFAILEQAGSPPKVDIVKPGSTVEINTGQTNRTYRVVSIKEDKVQLESKEGNVTYSQVVPLSDAPPGTGTQPGGYPGGAPGSGFPGSGGPGLGKPGRGGGPSGGGPSRAGGLSGGGGSVGGAGN